LAQELMFLLSFPLPVVLSRRPTLVSPRVEPSVLDVPPEAPGQGFAEGW